MDSARGRVYREQRPEALQLLWRTTSPRCAASLVSLNQRRTLDVITALSGADCGARPLAAPFAVADSVSDFGPAVNVGLSLEYPLPAASRSHDEIC